MVTTGDPQSRKPPILLDAIPDIIRKSQIFTNHFGAPPFMEPPLRSSRYCPENPCSIPCWCHLPGTNRGGSSVVTWQVMWESLNTPPTRNHGLGGFTPICSVYRVSNIRVTGFHQINIPLLKRWNGLPKLWDRFHTIPRSCMELDSHHGFAIRW